MTVSQTLGKLFNNNEVTILRPKNNKNYKQYKT